jgi:hypothetical protein
MHLPTASAKVFQESLKTYEQALNATERLQKPLGLPCAETDWEPGITLLFVVVFLLIRVCLLGYSIRCISVRRQYPPKRPPHPQKIIASICKFEEGYLAGWEMMSRHHGAVIDGIVQALTLRAEKNDRYFDFK